ncbi:unnamed protein product [Closterium sp. Yama58-4]|nr:unnamed protein product [Closterium sp. Yama58-4]
MAQLASCRSEKATGQHSTAHGSVLWRGTPQLVAMDALKTAAPSQLLAERGATLVVIHPGSLTLRIGLASSAAPLAIPHIIARLTSPNGGPPRGVEENGKSAERGGEAAARADEQDGVRCSGGRKGGAIGWGRRVDGCAQEAEVGGEVEGGGEGWARKAAERMSGESDAKVLSAAMKERRHALRATLAELGFPPLADGRGQRGGEGRGEESDAEGRRWVGGGGVEVDDSSFAWTRMAERGGGKGGEGDEEGGKGGCEGVARKLSGSEADEGRGQGEGQGAGEGEEGVGGERAVGRAEESEAGASEVCEQARGGVVVAHGEVTSSSEARGADVGAHGGESEARHCKHGIGRAGEEQEGKEDMAEGTDDTAEVIKGDTGGQGDGKAVIKGGDGKDGGKGGEAGMDGEEGGKDDGKEEEEQGRGGVGEREESKEGVMDAVGPQGDAASEVPVRAEDGGREKAEVGGEDTGDGGGEGREGRAVRREEAVAGEEEGEGMMQGERVVGTSGGVHGASGSAGQKGVETGKGAEKGAEDDLAVVAGRGGAREGKGAGRGAEDGVGHRRQGCDAGGSVSLDVGGQAGGQGKAVMGAVDGEAVNAGAQREVKQEGREGDNEAPISPPRPPVPPPAVHGRQRGRPRYRPVVVGEAALAIPGGAPYEVRRPMARGHLNASHSYPLLHVLDDLSAIWDSALARLCPLPHSHAATAAAPQQQAGKDGQQREWDGEEGMERRRQRQQWQQQVSAVVVVPESMDGREVKELVGVALTHLRLASVVVHQQAVAAAFGSAAPSACVVDVGAHTVSVACVEEGSVRAASRVVVPVGSEDAGLCLLWAANEMLGGRRPRAPTPVVGSGGGGRSGGEKRKGRDLESVESKESDEGERQEEVGERESGEGIRRSLRVAKRVRGEGSGVGEGGGNREKGAQESRGAGGGGAVGEGAEGSELWEEGEWLWPYPGFDPWVDAQEWVQLQVVKEAHCSLQVEEQGGEDAFHDAVQAGPFRCCRVDFTRRSPASPVAVRHAVRLPRAAMRAAAEMLFRPALMLSPLSHAHSPLTPWPWPPAHLRVDHQDALEDPSLPDTSLRRLDALALPDPDRAPPTTAAAPTGGRRVPLLVGLDAAIAASVAAVPDREGREKLLTNIVLTGGGAALPGLRRRIEQAVPRALMARLQAMAHQAQAAAAAAVATAASAAAAVPPGSGHNPAAAAAAAAAAVAATTAAQAQAAAAAAAVGGGGGQGRVEVEVLASRHPPGATAWRGGAVLGVLDWSRESWMTREEWVEGCRVGGGRRYRESMCFQTPLVWYSNVE